MFLLKYWVLPSLVMFLVLINTWRNDGMPPEEISNDDWCVIIICSILWPIGVFGHIYVGLMPILIKERQL